MNKLLLEITLMMLLLPGHLIVYSGGPEKLINLTSDNLTYTICSVYTMDQVNLLSLNLHLSEGGLN